MQLQPIFSRPFVFFVTLGLIAGLSMTAVAQEDEFGDDEVVDAEQGVIDFDIDGAHSSVVFRIKHQDVGYVFGMFREYRGDFAFDPDNLEESNFNFSIDAGSVFTNIEDRDNHLRSPDFFAAEEYPEITFESTEITHRSGDTYEITGELTMRGTTEEITMVADQTGTRTGDNNEFRRGFLTTFGINRHDFGVDFMPDGLGETVRVIVSVQGVHHP